MRALYPNRPVRGDDFPHSTGHSDDCIQAFSMFQENRTTTVTREDLGMDASTMP